MNYNTLSTLFSQRALAVVTILSLLMSAFPASFFVANIAEAATTETLSVTIDPDADPERVTISYAGASSIDLAGWTVEDAAANTHTITAGVIDNATDFVLCQDSGDTTGCDELGSGSAIWNNTGDTFFLKDPDGKTVFTFTFGDVDDVTKDFDVKMLDGKDSVEICHSGNGKNYVSNAPNVDGFINLYINDDKNGHHGHDYDIIPPFFYSTNDDEGYYPGKNWNDDNEEIWENKCKDPDADYATINLVKVVANENDPDLSQFDLTIGGDVYAHGDAVSVEIESNGGDFFTVSETNIPSGYTLLEVSCKDDSKDKYATGTVEAMFKLKDGDSYTCTVTNEKDVPQTGSITIEKVAGGNDVIEFDFDGDLGSFKLTGGASTTFDDLTSGTYEVYELAEADWNLLDVTCTDGSKWDDDDGVEIGLDEGEEVTCIFTNRPDSVEPPVCKIGKNLLDNGSFEDPAIDSAWALTNITDWVSTKVSNGTATLAELWRGLGVGASDGEQNVELGANEATILTQTVITTPGATYELRFDFAAREKTQAADNSIDALVDGVSIMNASGTETDWATYSQTFVADDASTDIAFKDTGTDNSLGSLLDNAVLCLVEEPKPEVYSCDLGMLFLDTETDAPDAMSLYTVDETDGSATFFADYELELHSAMAVDAAGVVYAIEKGTGNLVTLDDDSGAYTTVGATDLDAGKPVAMEIAPDGTLYVLTQDTDKLYEVDTTNGASVLLHDLELNVEGGDVVFESDMIVYVKNTGQVYGIDDATYDETLLGTIAVGAQRITSAATKDGVHYAYTRQNGFYPFTLNPFVASAPMLQTGPFAWGDGSYCPAEVDTEAKISGQKWHDLDGDGVWDEGETTIAGITICTENLENDDVQCLETNQLGYYIFEDIEEGDGYRVYEEVTEPWVQTYPESGECLIEEVLPGVEYYCDFGNYEPSQIACEPGVELLINGDFEEPVVTDGAGWDIFEDGETGLGWFVDWVSAFFGAPVNGWLELHGGVNGWLPSTGEQYAELDADWEGPGGGSGEEASVAISQTIDTIPGETYTLSWDFSPRPGTGGPENKLEVLVDGVVEETVSEDGLGNGNTVWTSYSYEFEATDDETTVMFRDAGTPNSQGTFLDNVSLVCEPEPEAGPYCGDGEVNQNWEQCEVGEEGCTDYCTFENQCQDLRLVKITFDGQAPTSESFDGTLHLGAAGNTIPNGTWFNFDEVGDDTVPAIANAVDGLAIERTPTELRIGIDGGDSQRAIDYAYGTIETKGIILGAVDKSAIPGWQLEDGGDYVDSVGKTDEMLDFEFKTGPAQDMLAVEVLTGEEYDCDDCLKPVYARVVLRDGEDVTNGGAGNLTETVVLGDGSTVAFGEWFEVFDGTDFITDPDTVTNYPNPSDTEGLFVSRDGDGDVKVALYGYHSPGGDRNYESLRATLEFLNAPIVPGSAAALPGNYSLENHSEADNVNSNDNFDEYDELGDYSGVDFDFWVDTKADGIVVTVNADEIAYCDDPERELYKVEGYVWEDEDEDGDWGEEFPLNGWTVRITDGEESYATTTDNDGYYYFLVPDGTWTITEDVEEGWSQTFPGDGTHEVTVPEELTLLDTLKNIIIPTVYADDVDYDTYGDYNFGNYYTSDSNGGGGGGSSAPRCDLEYERDGNDITLMWTTSKASELTVFQNTVEIYDTDDSAEVDKGEVDATITEDTTFEVVVKRGSRTRTCEVDVPFDGGAGGDLPEGRVAGEQQTRIIPVGPADAGAGGASRSMNVPLAGALIIGLAIVFGMRFTKVNG